MVIIKFGVKICCFKIVYSDEARGEKNISIWFYVDLCILFSEVKETIEVGWLRVTDEISYWVIHTFTKIAIWCIILCEINDDILTEVQGLKLVRVESDVKG